MKKKPLKKKRGITEEGRHQIIKEVSKIEEDIEDEEASNKKRGICEE